MSWKKTLLDFPDVLFPWSSGRQGQWDELTKVSLHPPPSPPAPPAIDLTTPQAPPYEVLPPKETP